MNHLPSVRYGCLWFVCLLVLLLFSTGGSLPPTAAPFAYLHPTYALADDVPFYLSDFPHVFITRTGACYHGIDNCRNTKVSYEISLSEAIRLGFTACDHCALDLLPVLPSDFTLPTDSPTVYYVVQDNYYHQTASCHHIEQNEQGNQPVSVTLDEALCYEKKPCKYCKPPEA